MSRTTSWARPRAAVALAATLALTSGALALSTPAHATPDSELSSERAKAAQLEAQIEANGNRVSILDEQFNSAQAAIDKANEQLAADERALEQRKQESETVQAELAARGAELYMGAGNPAPLAALDVHDTRELGSRTAYASAAADSDRQLLDRAKVAIEQLGVQQDALQRARAEATRRRDLLDAARNEIAQATAEQQQLLDEANGKIASLVAEVRAEREREQEAAARAAMERAAAEAQAQALAAQLQAEQTTTTDNGGSSGSGDLTDPNAGSPGNVPAPGPSAQVAVDTARAQLGKPYVYAGSGPDVFDCSGLTMYAWAAAGVSLPHNAEAQYVSLPHVSQSELEPGDLVFYGAPIHHVGIYVGGGTMIEAPYTGVDVRYHTIYRSDYAGAARP
jgi:cell wall-associated NlpC family hydrolase